MSETAVRHAPADLPEPDWEEIFRPAPPSCGLARILRRLIGVREKLLDRVALERPRYTRLGLIVVFTGLMAALSLGTALHRVVGVPWFAVIPVALFWGSMIVVIDSWLISSTHGASGRSRTSMFVPRLVVALLLGTVIAEPLVLWLLHPAIHNEIQAERNRELDRYESVLTRCNPVNGPAPDQAECDRYSLGLTSPAALENQLTTTRNERDQLRKELATSTAELQRLETHAKSECAGLSGPGLSGREGRGFRCDRAWQAADRYRTDSRIRERQVQLDRLDAKVSQLTADLSSTAANYGQRVEARIADKVNNWRADHQSVGLLDEHAALGRLSDRSGLVLAAQWLLRLLLITIDCLPVIAKWLGGTTTYDHLVARQLDAIKRRHHEAVSLWEQRCQATVDVETRSVQHERDRRMQEINEAERSAQERHDAELNDEIRRRAARYVQSDHLAGA